MGEHGECNRQLAGAQNLDGMLGANHPSLAQDVGIDGRLAEEHQLVEVHNVKFLAEDVGEAALRHAAMQRHLAAFKTTHHARTTARTLPFMSAGRGFAHAGPHTAADALLVLRCLFRCSNI
jgi:hypothetical protein